MNHSRRTHTRAEIRWAFGEIAELFIKCKSELPLKRAVNIIRNRIALIKLKARANHLYAYVVLLVNHNADCFIFIEQQRTSLTVLRKVGAD